MLHTQEELHSRHRVNEQNAILEEYNDVVESLKLELQHCKAEQNNIRSELIRLQSERQNAGDIREAFNRIHSEECCKEESFKEQLTNLNERIAALQVEKESALQLWQLSLATINKLEQELRSSIVDSKTAKFYHEQANNVKAVYLEATTALEQKLTQVKENFMKQQAMCQTNRERLEDITKERNDLMQKFMELQKEAQQKDRNNLLSIETLKQELSYTKVEAQKFSQIKCDLEKKLEDVRKFAETVVERDKDTKLKMAEALELIESAVREKDLVLHREALTLEEKMRLEIRLNTIASEYDVKILELSNKSKEEHERNLKNYLSEINELKFQLREKAMMLDKAEKDLKLVEDERERMRLDLDNILQKTNTKMSDHEQKLKQMKHQLQSQDSSKGPDKSDNEMKHLQLKIADLETKLSVSNDRLKEVEHQGFDRAKQTERKNADILEQYVNFENQLAKTLGHKEDLVLQLKSLKHDFDYEIQKRDNDRHFLENRIRELEFNLQRTNGMNETRAQNIASDAARGPTDNRPLGIVVENKCHCSQTALSEHITKLQEKFDKKTKELVHHVQVHQKLSKRWKDEAETLTTKFQVKTKELKYRINSLHKEKNTLSKELLQCKQKLAKYKMQEIQRYNEASELR